MGIVSEDIARVKESTDLAALISEFVPLKRSGRRYSGCCPFHEEKTPSFSVNSELGFYYCFGCGKKGDAISFLRDYQSMDFSDAVEYLAKKNNITLHYDKNESVSKSHLTPLYDALNDAQTFYTQMLTSNDEAKFARQYVRSRGFDKEVVHEFNLGYSPNSYDSLAKELAKKYPANVLIEAGLCYKNSRGNLSDVFRNRLMFPIHNSSGAVIGFGARALDATPPKYKNTSETKLYKKTFVLYNLDKAKSFASKEDSFVVCEGYTDVIAMSLAGIGQSVATCGTAATLEHVKVMQKYAKKIVLAFDSDDAGINATSRWLEFMKDAQADFFVANYGQSKDAAEVYLENPQLLVEAVNNAIPFLEFLLQRKVVNINSSTSIEEKARIAQEVVEIISKTSNPLVQEGYVMAYAPQLGFEPDWFFNSLNKKGNTIHKTAPVQTIKKSQPYSGDLRQRELLKLCIHEPSSVSSFIRSDVFTDHVYREIFESLLEHETVDEALESVSEPASEIFNQILVEDISSIEEVSPYSLDVFIRLVESQMKEFLRKLVTLGADNTSQVKRLMDEMIHSMEKADIGNAIKKADQLLDIKVESSLNNLI